MALPLILLSFLAITSFAAFPGWKAEPFPLSDIKLNPQSRYGQLQAEELTYLLKLDSSRLICLYMQAANISKTCNPYPHPAYYGHYLGHYLSSSAMIYSNTKDRSLQTKMNGIIQSLQQCETAWTNVGHAGYLFPYSPTAFQVLEGDISGRLPVAVPFYVMHKIFAGLIDQYIHANSTAALSLVTRMGNWVYSNVQSTIQKHGANGWQSVLNTEWGGMNEAMYNLYAITKTQNFLTVGNWFDHYSWTVPLAQNRDDLANQHANTHIPEISGSARGYEVNGNTTQQTITQNFFHILNTTRTFATGGSNDAEYWGQPHMLGDQMNANTEESCTQYNILKVARYLYTWTGDSLMADYYERAIMNGLVGNLNRNTPQYFYMNPLGGAGLHKPWGDAYSSFVCCWGSLTESFGKLSDSIYFHTTNSQSRQAQIFVNQYVASTLNWVTNGVQITQTTNYPLNSDGSTTSIRVDRTNNNNFILSLRVPWWTRAAGAYVRINGNAIATTRIVPKSYLNLGLSDNVVLKAGDVITVKFPMFARFEKLNDNRAAWADVGAFMYGPILLAGLTNTMYFNFNAANIEKMITPPTSGNQFTLTGTSGSIKAIPHMDVINEAYTIYFKNGAANILPYNPSGSTIKVTGAYDMVFTGGAGILANPLEAIRSGDPGQKNNGTVETFISNAQHGVQAVELDYQYISGYGSNGQGTGAQFALYLTTSPYVAGTQHLLYTSPHFTDYSYDQCSTCYSPVVKFRTTGNLNVDVSRNMYVFQFVFTDNDRNVQLLLSSFKITVFWT